MTHELRDGTEVEDIRLGRLVQFDERSRNYPVRTLWTRDKPRSYTWRCDKWLDQGREGACFPADTFVRMADGSHKKIQDIKLLDEVVTAEGNTGKVLELMIREADEGLVRVRVRGQNELVCTPEHPVLTQRGYVAAKDLTKDDRVAVTKYNNEENFFLEPRKLVNYTKIKKSATSGIINTGGIESEVSEIPDIVAKDANLGRLLGLYAAEGCSSVQKVVWSFSISEEETLVAETVDLLKTVFGIKARLQYRPNNSINVVAFGKAWVELFSILIPGTSKHGNKHLSEHVTSGPKDYLAAIITGWLAGDGYRRRTSDQGVTVCPQLALDMNAIGSGLGMNSAIRSSAPVLNRHAATRQRRWDVTFSLGDGKNAPDQTDGAIWKKVQSVVAEDFEGYVYNMHVLGDESYVASGIGVHNCVGFSFAHDVNARPVVRDVDGQFARSIYRRAQQIDEWPGEEPVYEGTSVLAGAKALRETGYLNEYRWAFGIDDLIMAVGWTGPAIIGVNWYETMFNTGDDGYIRVGGRIAGGHAILCNSVNLREERFTLHNSWGKDWGVDGKAKISFADMDRLLREQGEACIPVKRPLKK